MDMLFLHFRLIQSALDQKAEAKPFGLGVGWERSQGGVARRRHEVAGLPGTVEWHLGGIPERASSLLAKFDPAALPTSGRVAAYAVSGGLRDSVVRATTGCIRNARFTDEVPRRLGLTGRVTPGYKLDMKGLGHASEAGTVFPRPCPKGCQQRQSRGGGQRKFRGPCSERQNLRVPLGPPGFMGPVSPAIAATKWPGGTSSRQLAGTLSNSPQQPRTGQVAVRLR
jgi:hypothetical protein